MSNMLEISDNITFDPVHLSISSPENVHTWWGSGWWVPRKHIKILRYEFKARSN